MTKKLLRIILPLFCVGMIMACKSQKKSSEVEDPWKLFSDNNGFVKKEYKIIKDQDTWTQIQDLLYQNQTPKPAKIPMDFSKENVVLIALGERSTGGTTYWLESYKDMGDSLLVIIGTPYREPLGPATMNITQPVVLFNIPKTNASLVDYKIQEVK